MGKKRRVAELSRTDQKSSLGKGIKLQTYIFIFREGVFPRICIILAGMQRGGERVSLCSILSAILNRGGARRVFLKPISYLSCVYPCRDGSEACHTDCQQSEHATHRDACDASCLSHCCHIFPKRTTFLLIFSSQIVSTSL